MEDLMKELIDSVSNLNKFSWSDAISLISLIAAWITIILLLKDKAEDKRPYLQITFELVRDNLACIVLRNVGKVPLIIKDLKFDENFVKQLPKEDQNGLNNSNLNKITIFPNTKWIICLGVIIPEILEKYKLTELKINYKYSKLSKKKIYNENVLIDFKQYSRFLVYVSEMNELQMENKKIEKELKTANNELKNIKSTIVQYANINDRCTSTIVNGY